MKNNPNKSITDVMKGLSPIASVASSWKEDNEQFLVFFFKLNIFHDDALIYFLVIRSELCSNCRLDTVRDAVRVCFS